MSRDFGIILKMMSLAKIHKTIIADPENNLTASGSLILIHLSIKDGLTATEIANTLKFEKPFVTYVTKGLLAQGYIEVTRVDGRTVNISLTDKGKKMASATKDRIRNNVELVKKEYSKQDFDTTVDCIDKLLDVEKKIFEV